MSVRDKANQANTHSGQNYTKLHSDLYLRCKAKDGKGYFELVVGDEKRMITNPLEGYLVGQAMIMSAYDEKSGDSMFSAPYYTNKKISLFLRCGKKVSHILNGTKQECEDKAFEMRFGGRFKTKKVYYVASFTKDGTPKIFAIETSLPMAIELQKKINPSVWADYIFSFEPTLFDRNMELSDNCKEALKPLFLPSNSHMQMGYTNLVQKEPLTDEYENAMKEKGLDLEAVLDNFIAWKKEQGIEEAAKDSVAPTSESVTMPERQYEAYYGDKKTPDATTDFTTDGDDSDLPF